MAIRRLLMEFVGLNLADVAAFLTVAQTLSVFHPKPLCSLIHDSRSKKFECSIKHLPDKARELIVLEAEK